MIFLTFEEPDKLKLFSIHFGKKKRHFPHARLNVTILWPQCPKNTVPVPVHMKKCSINGNILDLYLLAKTKSNVNPTFAEAYQNAKSCSMRQENGMVENFKLKERHWRKRKFIRDQLDSKLKLWIWHL